VSRQLKVLSIDGGGIRGIVPALVLAEIERRTGRRIAEVFDIIAGTSTGGVLALGLVKPGAGGGPEFTAADLAALYEEQSARIFKRTLGRRLRSVGGALDQKYGSAGIEAVLDEHFRDTRLKDALTDVLITSYEIERRLPFFFRSSRAKLDPAYDFPMRLVARATSAAPTYFEPLRLAADGGTDYYTLVDGGVFANNPAMCGFAEIRKTVPGADLLVVSLGTGELTRRLPYESAKDWGLLEWAQPLLSVVFDGVSDTTDYELTQILAPDRYYRFQTTLDEGSDDIDDVSATNICALRLQGERLIASASARLDALVERLRADQRSGEL